MSKSWQQALLSSGLPLENDVRAYLESKGCVTHFEYSYLKPDEHSIAREFSYDLDAAYIKGHYFMKLMVECKYRHPGARWLFTPDDYGGVDELESNDFLHVVDDFMVPKFEFGQGFPRSLAPLCSKGIELLSDGANEKTVAQATHQLAYALAPQLASAIEHQANRWLAADLAFCSIPIIATTAELYRLKEGTTIQAIRAAKDIEEVAARATCLVLKHFPGADLQRYNRTVFADHTSQAGVGTLSSKFRSYTKDLSHYYSNLASIGCPRAMVVVSVSDSYAGFDTLFAYLDELIHPSAELLAEITTKRKELAEMVAALRAQTKRTKHSRPTEK